MNYRCPLCHGRLNIRKLFFRDVSTCAACGQKVVLGDFLAFAMAAVTMLVSALAALLSLNQALDAYLVAAGYAVAIGMGSGLLVLLLLGRAMPFRRERHGTVARPADAAPKA